MQVLLVDLGWAQTLWFLPALHRAGATVVFAVCGGADDRFLARYCTVRPLPRLDDPRFEASLRAEIESGGYDAIIAMSDDLLEACWRVVPDDREVVWPHVEPQYRRLVRDRAAVDALIRELDIPVPDRVEVDAGISAQALARVGLPCVVRGTQGYGGSQVRIARNEAEARDAFNELRAISEGRPYLQKFVTGPTLLVGGLFEHGEAEQWFAMQKLEVYPPGTGPSIRCLSVEAPREVEIAARIFRRLRHHGLGFVEFIRPPSGPPVFIELNPRPWGSVRAAAASGIDFLDLAAAQICGGPRCAPVKYKSGIEADLFPQFIGARLRSRRTPLRLAELRSWVRSLRAAPWSEPGLMLRFTRGLWWEWLDRWRKPVEQAGGAYGGDAGRVI